MPTPEAVVNGYDWVMEIRNIFGSMETELKWLEEAAPYCSPCYDSCNSMDCCGISLHVKFAALLAQLYNSAILLLGLTNTRTGRAGLPIIVFG
mmetsp:Transcript_26774/g.57545  ORF Transcript_26774/g.57545 Transcript_26774/m.57545 type:complete len:93 (-) Transcript_26774:2012-2290(-)